MQRYKLTIEYNGCRFSGMQHHEGIKSVHGTLISAISKTFGNIEINSDFCGRTDAGVHAIGQVVHFDAPKRDLVITLRGINFYLIGEDVVCVNAEYVDSAFHARFLCVQRTYEYRILNRSAPSVLLREYTMHVPKPLDLDIMQKCADVFVGTHDFTSFRSKGCSAKSPIKTIDYIHLTNDANNSEIIIITIAAKSFLYRMVRNVVGLLIDAGLHKVSYDDISTILKARDRSKSSAAAKAHGLYFKEAKYQMDT